MQNKKFEVKVYLFPKTYRVEAKTKAEALDNVLDLLDNMEFEEMEAEEIQKDKDSCENHFEFVDKCQDCINKLKENVER